MSVGASARGLLDMAATQAGDYVVSNLPDIHQLPLDAPLVIGEIKYADIMRRLDGLAGEPASVSAFNSSI
jgi:hypothetical protein